MTIELRGGCIGCNVRASAAKNIARQPNVSLFWPPTEPGGYALPDNAFWSWRTHGFASCPAAFNGCCPHAVEPINAPTTTTKTAFYYTIDLPTRPTHWS